MRIYVMQHGEALPRDVDADRPLSAQGRRDVTALADMLDQFGVRVAQVFHSGKPRARQSAELMAEHLTTHGRSEPRARLGPNDPVTPLVAEMRDWHEDTLVAGHMPYVSRLVSALVVGDEQQAVVGYHPGSIVCVEQNDDGVWLIAWALRPGLH